MTTDNNSIISGNQYDIQWQKVKTQLQTNKANSGETTDVSFKDVMDEINKTSSKKLPADKTYSSQYVDSQYYLSYISKTKNSKPSIQKRYAVNIPEEPVTDKVKTKPHPNPPIVKYGAPFGENIIRPLYAVQISTPIQQVTQKPTTNVQKNDIQIKSGNYTVPKGMGYENMLKYALKTQNIEPTKENLQKAKVQFKNANKPGTVHIYKGANSKLTGNEYLYANDKVIIPEFKI